MSETVTKQRVELNDHLPSLPDGVADAIEEVNYRWLLFARATTALTFGEAMTNLANAMSDLSTWHPGYDNRTGTLPWEREES